MITQPQLSVAVIGDMHAKIPELIDRLIAGEAHVVFRHPWLQRRASPWMPSPCWAVVRTPNRLVCYLAMTHYPNGEPDVGWHLHQADAVLIVVRACNPGAWRDILLMAAHRGLRDAIVWLTADGVGEDAADRVELDMRRALMAAGLPGDDVPVVRGRIDDLHAAIAQIRTPGFDTDGPARFVVRAHGPSADVRWRSARGRVERGEIVRGEVYYAFSRERIWPVWVERISRFGESLDRAEAGQNVEIWAREPSPSADHIIEPGTVIGPAGTVRLRSHFDARLTLFTPAEGGRSRHVMSDYSPSFLLPAVRRRGRMELLDRRRLEPGETASVRVTLCNSHAALIETGDAFLVRDGGRVVGHGTVTG